MGWCVRLIAAAAFCCPLVFSTSNAVAQVNCALFRSQADQARCAAANRAAAQAYWRERATTGAYYGGQVLNRGVGTVIRRVGPPGAGAAYSAGNRYGPYQYRAWQNRDRNRVPQVLQPGYRMTYPVPQVQGPPRTFRYTPPRRCGWSGRTWVCR